VENTDDKLAGIWEPILHAHTTMLPLLDTSRTAA
jgi:hypothetical protein